MQGGDLFCLLDKNGPLLDSKARFICYQLLLALKYLHEHNVCHRDLKLENIMLESDNSYPRLCLTDFGYAKAVVPANQISRLMTVCGKYVQL
jgi:serine/threonine-protein kinase Chk2